MITRNKDGYIPHLINDGSIDIKVEVRDKNGKQLLEKDISYVKESQLE